MRFKTQFRAATIGSVVTLDATKNGVLLTGDWTVSKRIPQPGRTGQLVLELSQNNNGKVLTEQLGWRSDDKNIRTFTIVSLAEKQSTATENNSKEEPSQKNNVWTLSSVLEKLNVIEQRLSALESTSKMSVEPPSQLLAISEEQPAESTNEDESLKDFLSDSE